MYAPGRGRALKSLADNSQDLYRAHYGTVEGIDNFRIVDKRANLPQHNQSQGAKEMIMQTRIAKELLSSQGDLEVAAQVQTTHFVELGGSL